MALEFKPAQEYSRWLPSGYRKRQVRVQRVTGPRKARVTSYWDGGSIDYFTLHRGGRAIPVSKAPPFPVFEERYEELQPGDVLVETGKFCGKQATAIITFVDAPAVPVSEPETALASV